MVSLKQFHLYPVVACFLSVLLSACDGDNGVQGPPGVPTTSTAESLSITIDAVEVNGTPVVDFTVHNEQNINYVGLQLDDLRFTIARLGTNGWQNYINSEETAETGPGTGNTAVQATRENDGELVDNADGTYRYTFATDITNVTTPVAVPYDATLTHRLAMQTRGSLPAVNAVYTFRPSDGETEGLNSREIVATQTCNECHNKLEAHDARIDTKYCVTCHNPGSSDANSGNTVDFKVMIHKIHRGENLPSVESGGEYAIWGFRDTKHDFSTVVFPQDIRHCTRCHDGANADTPEGDNWKTQISRAACGSCHDNIKFDVAGPPVPGATDPDGHPGGVVDDDSQCVSCHAENKVAGSVEQAHYLAEPVAREKFKLNILKICGVDVGTDPGPICAPGVNPSVTFSVTDPTNGDAKYDIATTPEITGSSLSFLVAWDTRDYHNTDGTGARPSRADSIDFDEAGFVDNADNTRTVTASFIIPDGTGTTGYTATGSGAIGAQGRLVGDFDNDGNYNESSNDLTGERERIFVKSEVAFFRIDDATVQPRRPTVDNAKCNKCHDQVSFHGGSRSGEYGVCILCHNPNNTDIDKRGAGPFPDGKAEESIDMKRMIHGIHAGAKKLYDGSPAHGFRNNGLVLYGYGGGEHDYSHVRFPGILNDCETCHEPESYFLQDTWESPTANDILSSTVDSGLSLDDPDDDGNISPTAAVCSACHDSDVAKAHMVVPGGAVFDETQTVISSTIVETCSVCHGPGRDADVAKVHAKN